jgi:hypothetical protein
VQTALQTALTARKTDSACSTKSSYLTMQVHHRPIHRPPGPLCRSDITIDNPPTPSSERARRPAYGVQPTGRQAIEVEAVH